MRPKSLKKPIKHKKNSSTPTQRLKRPQQSLLQQQCSFSLWRSSASMWEAGNSNSWVIKALSQWRNREAKQKSFPSPIRGPKVLFGSYWSQCAQPAAHFYHPQTSIPQVGVSSESRRLISQGEMPAHRHWVRSTSRLIRPKEVDLKQVWDLHKMSQWILFGTWAKVCQCFQWTSLPHA